MLDKLNIKIITAYKSREMKQCQYLKMLKEFIINNDKAKDKIKDNDKLLEKYLKKLKRSADKYPKSSEMYSILQREIEYIEETINELN